MIRVRRPLEIFKIDRLVLCVLGIWSRLHFECLDVVEEIGCPVILPKIKWAIRWQGDSRKIIKGINSQTVLDLGEIFDSLFQLFNLGPSLGVHIWKKNLGRGVDHLRDRILSHGMGLQGLHDFS